MKEELKNLLGSDISKKRVDIFIKYIDLLESEKDADGKFKNTWVKKVKPDEFEFIFKKVAIDNVFIDGEVAHLTYNDGQLAVVYSYHAYKNVVLGKYPDTKFDIQLVHKGDDFEFNKESGGVFYSHKINNPFETKREIIGAYCVIKNERGEFLETMNMDDIKDIRDTSEIQDVWDKWLGEMILKSIIKRSCKRHFRDETKNIDKIDNENYNPNSNTDSDLKKEIKAAGDYDSLTEIYEKNKGGKNEVELLELLNKRKEELRNENL